MLPKVNQVSNRPESLDLIDEMMITFENKKLWEARQKEYLRGIICIVPQQLLVNCGIRVSPVKRLFEWSFWGRRGIKIIG